MGMAVPPSSSSTSNRSRSSSGSNSSSGSGSSGGRGGGRGGGGDGTTVSWALKIVAEGKRGRQGGDKGESKTKCFSHRH